ncbi:hypothetical protein R5R35_007451 [Gryllus longicercus]|uniref:General transcription factor 3C polypeptide 3 n=1 Tax=Gryllus longicercus TaxID=2509291 RepID=A0AAN9Z3U6_9ORTH
MDSDGNEPDPFHSFAFVDVNNEMPISDIIIEEIENSSIRNQNDLRSKLEQAVSESEISESSDDDQGPPVQNSQDGLTKEKESELTNNFLDGKLSFSEYASLMEGHDAEDTNDTPYSVSAATVDAFERELKEATLSKTKTKRMCQRRRRRRGLPPALLGLMGEANVRYARGEKEVAISMCLEIIRQMPTAPEPFHTLSVLYEEMGAADKALQFALIAAHLSPQDVNQWIRLAESSEEQGNIKQAITCYSKAVIADPTNIKLHLKRCSMLEELGDRKSALRGYLKLLSILTPDQGNTILKIAKNVAQKFHDDRDILKAKEAMEIAFNKVPHLVTPEDVNIMLELLLNLKDYSSCLSILVQYCNIEVEAESEVPVTSENIADVPFLKILSCNLPENLPIDLQGKLIIVMIYLKAFHLVDGLLTYFLGNQIPEVSGDLYLDIAEALMDEGKYEDALKLLNPLLECKTYSMPAVWLRQGECLKACHRLEEAAKAYEMVTILAPQHLDARIILSSLWRQLGHLEKAISVLTQDEETEILQPGLLYKRCMLLKETPEKLEEFLAVGQLLLYRHCTRIRNRDELDAVTRLRRPGKKTEALKEVRAYRGEPLLDSDTPEFVRGENEPTVQEEWQLLVDLLNACYRSQNFPLLQRLAFSALGSGKFHTSPDILKECEFICLLACFYNGDEYYGYNFARDHILRNMTYPRAWNLFNLIIQRADDVRHNRFVMRLLGRMTSEHKALTVLHANNCLVSGTYKYALSEYTTVFKNKPCAPLAFFIGVTLFQMACQKFSAKKHSLVSQGLSFFCQYEKLRGECAEQEIHYNFGRAFHQLGLLPPAIHHYREALKCSSHLTEKFPHLLDLKREAAFNLHLIYMHSGNHELARTYIEQYIVV